ncbi:hypothetical protein PMAYCL1PPCAC_15567, partial [Pristionchus mayeri]
MRSAVVLLAIVAAASATAILRSVQEVKETNTKEVKQHKLPKGTFLVVQTDWVESCPSSGWYIKPYYHTFAETGKYDVLNGMFCKICEDLVDFGEETAMDYLSDATKELCDQLPYANLQKDCYNYIMSIAQDLLDLLNDQIDGDAACTAMTLC